MSAAAAWIAVAAGGALGSVARFGAGQLGRSLAPASPWVATLAVNVLGSFLIGVLFAWFLVRPASDWVRLGLTTGLLGGFTTFSAFSVETLDLLRTAGPAGATAYVAATLALGLIACAIGMGVARGLLLA
jgi:fluoride exporter